jgi:hypothetical protein
MGRHHYHFVSHWRVAGNVEEVSAVFRDGQDLARWWPAVYLSSTVVDPGDESGLGYTVALQSKGFLPYTIRWWAKATEVRHPYGYTIETSGDFVGRGVWTFAQDGDSVNIDYDWRIVADKPLLRYGAAVLKPLYAFNHHWAMARGAESLARGACPDRAATGPVAADGAGGGPGRGGHGGVRPRGPAAWASLRTTANDLLRSCRRSRSAAVARYALRSCFAMSSRMAGSSSSGISTAVWVVFSKEASSSATASSSLCAP